MAKQSKITFLSFGLKMYGCLVVVVCSGLSD